MDVITCLRKYFNFPNRLQKSYISIQFDMVENRCRKIADAEYQDELKSEEFHNHNCPNCRAKKDQIVNKICNVQSKGNTSGSFWFGMGDIDSSFSIETTEVNHCNACGNEWEKFKIKRALTDDITRVALRYLMEIINDGEQKQYDWKLKTIEVFDLCYAETINELYKKNKKYYAKPPKLATLRKYYLTVYNRTLGIDQLNNLQKL